MNKSYIVMLLVLLLVGLVLPAGAMGAGDDCPDPGDGGANDPSGVQDPGDDDEEDTDSPASPASEDEGTGSGGLFGSLGVASSSQMTLGALIVVGVVVGAVYLMLVGRFEDDDEEP